MAAPSDAIYHPQYSYSDGDIVLVTSDDVCFRVHSVFLKTASSFFGQLYTNRGPRASANDPVRVSEGSEILAAVLNFIYPNADLPDIPDLDYASRLAAAADKYNIPRVMSSVRDAVTNREDLRTNTLQLYALACRWKWDDVVQYAAQASILETPLPAGDYMEYLKLLDTQNLLRLLQFHWNFKAKLLKGMDEACSIGPGLIRDEEGIAWTCNCKCTTYLTSNIVKEYKTLYDNISVYLDESPVRDLWESEVWITRGQNFWAFRCVICRDKVADGQLLVNALREYAISLLDEWEETQI